MSRSQDPHPSRSIFPFGNPFRMKSHKGSHLSPQLLGVLQGFETTLSERLRKLMPKSKDEILTLAWMTFAMKSLCESHNDIRTLITDLELPVSVWDDKWVDVYFDISTKLLDICNAFSSELSRLNQGNLPLKCALHHLGPASSKSFLRACSLLDDWRRHINAKNPRIEKCSTILDGLVGSLDLPKVKNSAKGKVLMQAMYGVKVETVFVCSVFSAAFSGSSKKLLDLDVADVYAWTPAFKNLQNLVNEEIRVRFSSGKFSVLNELEAVDAIVKELYPTIQGGENTEDKVEQESHLKTVEELGSAAEKLSQGMDLLAKGVDGFFQAVLTSRDTLLSSLRFDKTVNDRVVGRNMDQQVVY
ncbi:BPS1 protein [Trifolium repens]|nr:BPS1 protein [Trifolium repens]